MWQWFSSLQVWAMPMIGLARSMSSKPEALLQARMVSPQLRASRRPRVLREKESAMVDQLRDSVCENSLRSFYRGAARKTFASPDAGHTIATATIRRGEHALGCVSAGTRSAPQSVPVDDLRGPAGGGAVLAAGAQALAGAQGGLRRRRRRHRHRRRRLPHASRHGGHG